jgi:hypothetical protein
MDGSGDGPRTAIIDSSSSPLQVFVQAKKSINDIFTEIEEYVKETCNFVQGKIVYSDLPLN